MNNTTQQQQQHDWAALRLRVVNLHPTIATSPPTTTIAVPGSIVMSDAQSDSGDSCESRWTAAAATATKRLSSPPCSALLQTCNQRDAAATTHTPSTTITGKQSPSFLGISSLSPIPAHHRYKLCWDALTLVLSLVWMYQTHRSIRNRQYNNNQYTQLCNIWFLMDIILTFATQQHLPSGRKLDTFSSIWANYLTSWFLIDVLSLLPGEVLFVQPIIDRENKRNLLVKTLFRSRAVLRVTRRLRHHWLGLLRVIRSMGPHKQQVRFIQTIVKYLPKYLLFYRNMRVVMFLRCLRQWHWMQNMYQHVVVVVVMQWKTKQQHREEAMDDNNHGDENSLLLLLLENDDDDDFGGLDDDNDDWEYSLQGDNDGDYLDDDGDFWSDEEDLLSPTKQQAIVHQDEEDDFY